MDREFEPLIDAYGARELLGLESCEQVYRYAREGILPSVRLGRLIRFDRRALRDFVAAGGQALPGGWRREDGGAHRGA